MFFIKLTTAPKDIDFFPKNAYNNTNRTPPAS